MGAGGRGEVGVDQPGAGDRVWLLHWSHFGVSGSSVSPFTESVLTVDFHLTLILSFRFLILNSTFAGNVVTLNSTFARIVINSCYL